MRAYHNSRELKFRDPFGAVTVGGAVSISIDTWDVEPDWVELRLRVENKFEKIINMERSGGRFTCTVTPETADVYWYSFICRWFDGGVCRYGPRMGRVGGVGEVYYGDYCPEYQMTVYTPRKVPDWYKNAICYQIFPDRFYRGTDFAENAEGYFTGKRRGTPKALVKKWDTPVGYKRTRSGRIKVWEFYGGTLRGIEEKLDYLTSLGITALYLNPIFEAASNHRYDTGDYEKIDGLLGDEAAFKSLARACEKRGIRIILDGVFNHTGCDSRYFNKFGNYPEPGAYQGPESKYYEWFRFDNSPAGYECWWGVDDLPNVEEHRESFKKYIYGGKNSIVRRWLRLGASGWRLDVADELPDDFIEGIKSAVVAEKGDEGLLMGEVWEDASNKRAYGELRRYFLGTELDCVMNYPFRTGMLDYLTFALSAEDLNEMMLSIRENYPPENFMASLNLMGSHDRPRVMTVLGGAVDPSYLTEDEKREYRLTEDKRRMAKSRLWLMALMQLTLPGVPCIYYGDEAGMEGFSDPYNRGTFPWGHEDRDNYTMYRNAINIRKMFPELTQAGFGPFAFGPDVFGYHRDWADGEGIAVLVNRGYDTRTVTIGAHGEEVTDVLGGVRYSHWDGAVTVTLWPMGSAVLYFHKKTRLARTLERGSGVFTHITGLPNESGSGNIGKAARDFVDNLAKNGLKYWQIMPLNPADAQGSPCTAASAFAADISLLPESEEELRREYDAFSPDGEFREFCDKNGPWLEPYCAFMAIKKNISEKPFTAWPKKYRKYTAELPDEPELKVEAGFRRFCQYKFYKAWRDLRDYANSRGVLIIGEMPMYVTGDSADVWSEPGEFTVDKTGRAELVTGAPPTWEDEGQLWGSPMYDWEAMEKTGYDWWMRRFGRMLDMYDYVKLDQFADFESAWAIPAGKKPREGRWIFGPGMKLFNAAFEKFGSLPFMAEDHGTVSPAARALLARCGFLDTDVIQFQI